MRGHEPEAPAPAQRGQRVDESDGVGSPGEADDDRPAVKGEAVGLQGPVDGRDEGRQPHDKGLLARGAWWRCRDSNPGRRGYEPRALTN